MKRTDAATLALNLMREHDLVNWIFKFDGAVRRLGNTNFNNRTISLSGPVTDSASEAQVVNTIRHEVAHAIVGFDAGHGPVWQRQARALGCNAQRCTSTSELEMVKPPLALVCVTGDHVIRTAYRKSKVVNTHGCPRHKQENGKNGQLAFRPNN